MTCMEMCKDGLLKGAWDNRSVVKEYYWAHGNEGTPVLVEIRDFFIPILPPVCTRPDCFQE